jgi:hypothetical protein
MNPKGFATVIILVVVIVILVAGYFVLVKKPAQVVQQTYTPVSTQTTPIPTSETANWQTYTDTDYNFEFKYPSGFFDINQEPKVLIGDCNYSAFPDTCPDINNIVIKDLASSGGDINAIENNLSSPNYWQVPGGQKSTINNVTYCLYQTGDAAMSHQYNSYYYATVTNNKCLVVNLNTSTTNCQVYLPIETGNTQQQKDYNNCLITNRDQPKILSQIVSTFKFTNNAPSACVPNWQCGWGPCVNGGQSMIATDSNNCGLPPGGHPIACPALARICK